MIISVDNGVSGWIAVLNNNGLKWFAPMPIKRVLNYTKKKQWLNRVDVVGLLKILESLPDEKDDTDVIAILERPMVNPMRWKASASALRCMEATLVVLELCKIPYEFIDSKEWQRAMLPAGLQKEELKEASDSVAKRLFPEVAGKIKAGSGDALLIARYWQEKREK